MSLSVACHPLSVLACRSCVILGTLLGALELTAGAARAGDWMYRRSYFTDSGSCGEPTPLVPDLRSRWAYRRPIAGTGFGYAVRGGYRFNRFFLRSGQSTDATILREDWFDERP